MQNVLALAELQHELTQQLRAAEDRKLALTEQKLATQRRVIAQLDAQLRHACAQVPHHLSKSLISFLRIEVWAFYEWHINAGGAEWDWPLLLSGFLLLGILVKTAASSHPQHLHTL